jgi:midasin
LPKDYDDEESQEGATQFEDIQGGGLGEGEGMKDVSDQIENEDQLEDTRHPGQEEKEENSEQPELKSEDNAIEMSDDFEGKMHDMEAEGLV